MTDKVSEAKNTGGKNKWLLVCGRIYAEKEDMELKNVRKT